jgi:hypothetical protein
VRGIGLVKRSRCSAPPQTGWRETAGTAKITGLLLPLAARELRLGLLQGGRSPNNKIRFTSQHHTQHVTHDAPQSRSGDQIGPKGQY